MSNALGSGVPRGRFPASSRVRKRSEFLSIQDRGQRVSTPRFVLILSASSAPGSPRLGITASRRVGNSVVRSRSKRLVREAFRATRELWPAGVDLVVIVKRAPEESKLESVISEWLAARAQIERRLRALLGSALPSSPRDAAPREPAAREAEPHKIAQREAGVAQREAAAPGVAQREAAVLEPATHEADARSSKPSAQR